MNRGKSVHERFEAQAATTPDACALSFEGKSLTYAELNRRSNQVARFLTGKGIGPDVLVGLYLERSIEMVVCLLGILKAGGAYVPLDPAYPAERLALILEDSQAPVVLTQEGLAVNVSIPGAQTVYIDRSVPEIERESAENLASNTCAEHLAYVIYTSGSTGKPKGALITHGNVTRLFDATEPWFGFGEKDVWTLFHSCAFDFSVWEIWGALLYGGRLIIVPFKTSRAPQEFYRLLCRERVTVLNQTPSAFMQLIRAEQSIGVPDDLHLKWVIFGGEALDLKGLKPWFERRGDKTPKLINMYGITETTVHVTYRPLSIEDAIANNGSMIGEPIPDLQIYLLDEQLNPVADGTPGEIFVGGAGVARGYLNRPELTAARFVRNPFHPDSAERLYRSGDLARRTADGDLEYIGRKDRQVKIRGFRIELGEIEAAIAQFDGIAETIVALSKHAGEGEKSLVAYLVLRPAATLDVAELRRFLHTRLPEYMLPSAFVKLESFPLTVNGKIDRDALPDPDAGGSARLQPSYAAPTQETELLLAKVWERVLQIKRAGVNDNFNDLGGNSLLMIEVLNQLNSELNIKLPETIMYEHPTIRSLAQYLVNNESKRPSGAQENARKRTAALLQMRASRRPEPGQGKRL